MALTGRQLNRATLARQLLLERRPADVVEGVRLIVALQAQEPASPYIALWNRLAGFDPARLDEAFVERSIVKATLMRITLHAVAADEYTQFHEAMLRVLRSSRLGDRRYTSTGLTIDDVDDALHRIVRYTSQPRSKDEIIGMLSDGSPVEPRLWWALRTFAPLIHVPTGGPWSFGRSQEFATAPTTPARLGDRTALQHLVWRYLEGFGPATAQDFGQFALQRQAEIGAALEAMADRLAILEGPGGETLFDIPGGLIPPADTPAPARLLGMWDSILLAYRDRRRVIPDEYRAHVIRRNGDVLPTVLVDGYVSGVWRPTDDGIEVKAFRPMSDHHWNELVQEAGPLSTLVASRDPNTYRRYSGWWSKLPQAELRTIGQSATA
jgi:hypothetical protein